MMRNTVASIMLVKPGLSFVPLLMLLASSLPGSKPQNIETRIDRMTEAMMSCLHVPGLSLAMVHKGQVVLQKGYGHADIEAGVTVNENTLFPIASTTKAFTTTLLAMLLNNTRYDWDTPVREILGTDFEMYTPELSNEVTLRDLLSHRTGLPGNFVPLMAGYPENMTLKQIVSTMRYHKPIAPFRTTFLYNNFMYAIAGHVAEVLAGAGNTWESLTRDNIFAPLGMTSSTFISASPYKRASPVFAQPYVMTKDGELMKVETESLHQVDVSASAGAIVSSAADMSRWLLFHLQHGKTQQGRTLIGQRELDETYQAVMPSPSPMNRRDLWQPRFPVSDVHTGYGLAWMNNVYRGYKRVSHSGGISTYKSQLWLYPHLELGMYVAVNGPPTGGTSWGLIHLLHYMTDLMIEGAEPWLNTSTICSFPAPWAKLRTSGTEDEEVEEAEGGEDEVEVKPVKDGDGDSDSNDGVDDSLPRPVDDYVGTFAHPGFGQIIIQPTNSTTTTNATTYSSSSSSEAPAQLQLSMGRYLRCLLYYSSKDEQFSCRILGSLAYTAQAIPTRMRSSSRDHTGTGSADLDTLDIPLYGSVDVEQWTSFTRGDAAGLQEEQRNSMWESSDCTSSASTSTLHRLLYVITIISGFIIGNIALH